MRTPNVNIAAVVLILLHGCVVRGPSTAAPIEHRQESLTVVAYPAKPVAAAEHNTKSDTPARLDPALSAPSDRVSAARPPDAEPVRPLLPASRALVQSALVAVGRGDWERAQAALERALRLEPDNAALWRQLAYTHHRRGATMEAELHAQRAASLSVPGSDDYRQSWALLVDIYAATGDEERAGEARNRAAN